MTRDILALVQVSSEKVRNVNSDPQLGFVNAHGYVSLFPFLLQILSPDSDKLGGVSYIVHYLASFVQQNSKLEDTQILLGDHLSHMWGQFATNPRSFGGVGHTAH